jgi:RHS repeat-associated protein
MVKYYYAGSTRIAMRQGSTLNWLFGDHLGSTSAVANENGSAGPTQLYKPWGEKRPAGASSLPTTYRYTSQRQDSYINLYWYGSRWYDDQLGRWIQPDWIIPEDAQGVQAWDRYAYTNNNPVRYNDPTGHCVGPLALICVAIIEAAPIIFEFVAYAATTYIVADQLTSNQTYVNGKPVDIGIVILPGPEIPLDSGLQSSEIISGEEGPLPYGGEPEQLRQGNDFHYGTGPEQLKEMYPDTDFAFKRRGQSGPDVEVVGGMHPSEYPNSSWNPENNYGDFKSNTIWSEERFLREIENGKLPRNTQPLPYNRGEKLLLPQHKFRPWQ